MKTILLIDGHNLLFRMFYGIPNSIKNNNGKEIKGLIGFVGSIKKYIKEFKPYSVLVVFDSETSRSENKVIDSSYKSNRKDYSNVLESENPFSQYSMITKALDFLDISNFEVEQYEADDFISSIINQKKYKKYIIVSNDTDFIQLINQNVSLYSPRGKLSVLYDEETIIKKYSIKPSQYIEYKALIGDNADNIKGVNKIGIKTATSILKYGTIKDYLQESGNEKIKELLLENKFLIIKNIKLITLNKNINLNNLNFKSLNYDLINMKVKDIIFKIDES